MTRVGLGLRPGDLVSVRIAEEVLQTLDGNGALDGLPFMPEMLEFCGRQFRVLKKAEKTCVEGAAGGIRGFKNNNVYLLEGLRCSGLSHDGCQRACMLFWKEAWLTKDGNNPFPPPPKPAQSEAPRSRLETKSGVDRFVCQSTELARSTRPLSRLQRVGICFHEVLTRNCGLARMIRLMLVPAWKKVRSRFLGRHPSGKQSRTPVEALHLRPGEWVEVKSLQEIAPTLDVRGRNRGLPFGFDMNPFCGRRYRVKGRIEKMILEATGEMRNVENTVLLDGVTCPCHYVIGGCPRQEFVYWRETWLRRVPQDEEPFPGRPGVNGELNCVET